MSRARSVVMPSARWAALCAACCARCSALGLAAAGCRREAHAAEPRHAIAMHGEPALPAGFTQLPYANPDRAQGRPPRAGRARHLRQPQSLHRQGHRPAVDPRLRGRKPDGARLRRAVHALRTDRARRSRPTPQRSYVTFHLDPAARFSDGKPVTAEDVIFSWQLLRDKGRPNHRTYYAKVAKAEALGERTVRFDLSGSDDRELPLILGLMPVLAKHAINPETFEETSLQAAARQRPLRRRRGRPRQERDAQAQSRTIGAAIFRSIAASGISTRSASTTTATPTRISRRSRRGLYDVRTEHDPGRWQTGLRLSRACATAASSRRRSRPACRRRAPISCSTPAGRSSADIRVREAISLLFDFEWINHNYLLRSLSAHRELFRRLGAVLARPAGRRARARAARAVPRRRARRRARRHLVAAGQRRLRPRPRDAQARARPVRGRRLRAARHRTASTRTSGRPFTFEIMVTDARTRSGSRCCSRRASSAPASPRACAWSTRCSTSGGASPTIST